MSKVVVTEREVRLARAFLARIRGNQQNTYLLLALIAWTRAMAKAHDPFWKTLARYSPTAAGIRLADKLAARARTGGKSYTGVLAAIRRYAKTNATMATQATDFLRAIEKSAWDPHHYGYVAATDGKWVQTWVWLTPGTGEFQWTYIQPTPENDPLRQAWASLTGHPIPPKWFIDTTTATHQVKVPPRPSQPRSLLHVLPTVNYIQPYAAQQFYDARPHYGSMLLTDG